MINERINELLVEAVGKYGLLIGILATKNITKKLPTCSEIQSIDSNEKDPFLNARNALMESGKVLLEDRSNETIEGVIYSGAGNMNPSIVVVSVTGKKITIAAYAKEGLINQHTAKKAVNRFISVL